MFSKPLALLASLSLASAAGVNTSSVEIAPGVVMPSVNLGTCCGSQPKDGLQGWLDAGGRGIDTAFDYSDQVDIAAVLAKNPSITRSELFITTKVPAGFGNLTDCSIEHGADVSYGYVQENLRELGVDYVDLVLLHAPCLLGKEANNALWSGLQRAKQENLTRAIGVSNYNSNQLKGLTGAVPSVNQCMLNPKAHDDVTIKYCEDNGIQYEAYYALKGCDQSSDAVTAAAKAHSKTTVQVCLRWILQYGSIMAVGTGANSSTAKAYAAEDLDLFDFELTQAEQDAITKSHLQ